MQPKYFCIFLLLLFGSQPLFSQQNDRVEGVVKDENNAVLPGAHVSLQNRAETITDENGSFHFNQVNNGKVVIAVKHLGYSAFMDTLTKNNGEILRLEIRLYPDTRELQQVNILGKTENKEAGERPIKSIVIDTRALSTQAVSITDLMNRSTGVRIRQGGGVGSRPEVSVNGFQGKAIKYFRDGIPLDYLGRGYSIASVPLELFQRVEIYKGVLPVSLGADALGGAVNFVTEKPESKKIQAYYEAGSFQTHRAGVSGSFQTKDKKWLFGGNLFLTHSKNKYKATVQVLNPETRNLEPERLPMFHNAFHNYYGELFAALENRSWADELRLSLIGFSWRQEQQHPALMTDSYGALFAKQKTLAPTLRYKKSLAGGKVEIDQFASYNELHTGRIDTLHGAYDWYGKFTPKSTRGESRLPSLSSIKEAQVVSRSNINYHAGEQTLLTLNYVLTNAIRHGTDPYGAKLRDTGIDLSTLKSYYQKQVMGLGVKNKWLDGKIQNNAQFKFYHFHASGIQNTWYSSTITDIDRTKQNGSYWGAAEAFKYQLSYNSFIRASGEYAYRLPEREELYGNNVFIVPNFELKPERSLNLNLGYRLDIQNKWIIEANAFYRRTRDLILLIPIQAPNAQYQNQENVKGGGFDLDVSYRISSHYQISGNATWQDLRLFGITKAQDQWKNKARLRNTPYFFANAGWNADYENVFQERDKMKVYLNYNFLREFYLETIPKDLEPGGFLGLSGSAGLNTNLIIPNQHNLSLGMTYQFASEKFSIGWEVRNIFNQDLFDYYRIQKPGRAASIKVSYQF